MFLQDSVLICGLVKWISTFQVSQAAGQLIFQNLSILQSTVTLISDDAVFISVLCLLFSVKLISSQCSSVVPAIFFMLLNTKKSYVVGQKCL